MSRPVILDTESYPSVSNCVYRLLELSVSGAALHKIVEWLELNMSSRMSYIPIRD